VCFQLKVITTFLLLINVHGILGGAAYLIPEVTMGIRYGIYSVILWVECGFTELRWNEKMLTLSNSYVKWGKYNIYFLYFCSQKCIFLLYKS